MNDSEQQITLDEIIIDRTESITRMQKASRAFTTALFFAGYASHKLPITNPYVAVGAFAVTSILFKKALDVDALGYSFKDIMAIPREYVSHETTKEIIDEIDEDRVFRKWRRIDAWLPRPVW